jgi:murein DD-endopeptidase MepM/ murein hydrolase activator NlpD
MKKRFTALLIVGGGVALALAVGFSVSAADRAPVLLADLGAEQRAAAIAYGSADNAFEAEQLSRTYEKILTVGDGDTLMAMLTDSGADRRDAHNAIVAMSEIFKPRYLKPGQEIQVTMRPGLAPDAPETLISLKLTESVEREIVVRRDGEEFIAEAIDHPLTLEVAAAEGVIESSLFLAGEAAGVPLPVLADLINIYSFDVDFQRDIQKNDSFTILYERFLDENGTPVRTGNILRASMTLSGKDRTLYRFTMTDGLIDYFDTAGKSARRALMRTPINGARLSSSFGNRRHPVLGYTKLHTGVDFAAPKGTPIYAAGGGSVIWAGRKGANGLLVKIRHNGTYTTAYAHMSGIARGVRRGTRVQQGQVIGYVGTTGRSTGNHLHYEVHRNGKPINPRAMRLPSGRKLKGSELVSFQMALSETDLLYAGLIGARLPKVAAAEPVGSTPCGGPLNPC